MKSSFFLSCFAVVSLAAQPAKSQSGIQLLSSGTWHIMAMGIDNDGDGVQEKTIMRPCNVGSTLIFAPDGSGIAYKGPKPCNPAAPSAGKFTWTSKAADAVLVSAEGQPPQAWKILAADEHKLMLWMTVSKLLYTLQKK